VTGTRGDPADLLRFVTGPDGTVVPDIAGDLPGRGMWVTATRSAVAEAVRRKAFSRAARAPVRAGPELADLVAELLRRHALARLGLAQRGGGLVTGADKVRDWIVKGRAGVLIQASDGAADGRRRLAYLAQALPLVALYEGQALSLALGRENVVHAAGAAGGAAARIVDDAVRLQRFLEIADQPDALLSGTGIGVRLPERPDADASAAAAGHGIGDAGAGDGGAGDTGAAATAARDQADESRADESRPGSGEALQVVRR